MAICDDYRRPIQARYRPRIIRQILKAVYYVIKVIVANAEVPKGTPFKIKGVRSYIM